MKRVTMFCIILGVLLLSNSLLSAQESRWSFGMSGGVNVSEMKVKGVQEKPIIGLNLGIVVDYALADNFFLRSGLSFSQKGYEIDEDTSDPYYLPGYSIGRMYPIKMTATYLELPIMIGRRKNIGNNLILNFGAGPYFAIGIGGRTSVFYFSHTNGYHPVYAKGKIATFSNDMLRRFDMGFGGRIGLEYKRVGLNLGYEWGLIDHLRGSLSSYNRNALVTLGYRIK